MKSILTPILALAAFGFLVVSVHAESIRYANGRPVRGQLVEVKPEGLVIKSTKTQRLLLWKHLSWGTRYRYDSAYKKNLEAYLDGKTAGNESPPAPEPNDSPPEPDKKEEDPPPAPPPEEEKKPPPPPAEPKKEKKILGVFQYKTPPIMKVSEFPKVPIRDAELTKYIGLQFGAGAKDVAYLVFDTDEWENIRDIMYVHVPGHAQFGRPVKFKGKKTDNGEKVEFKPIKLKGSLGPLSAEYKITCSLGFGGNIHLVFIEAEALLKKGANRYKILLGQYPEIVPIPETIKLYTLVDNPVFRLIPNAPRATTWSTILIIEMGAWRLVPLQNMEKKFRLQLSDSKNKVLERENVDIGGESIFSEHGGVHTDFSDLDPETPYSVNATIDLGPLLGKHEKSVSFKTIKPKPKKKKKK